MPDFTVSFFADQSGHSGHSGHAELSGAVGGTGSALLAGALITNRDGIVGRWLDPKEKDAPPQLAIEEPANLARWSRHRRGQIIDFEIGSRLGFSAVESTTRTWQVTVWHAQMVDGDPPTATYRPVVRLTRPDDLVFLQQVRQVAGYADLRGDRAAEILAQMDGGLPFFSSMFYMSPDKTPYTLELLDAVFRSVQAVEMRVKHALASRRPVEFSEQMQPMIETPAHSSFPSGHATESFAYAIVLIRLLAGMRPGRLRNLELLRQAARIAVNRQVAGLHFPADSAAGAVLGLTLGEYLVARFQPSSPTYRAWRFNGHVMMPDADFQLDFQTFFDAAAYNGLGAQIATSADHLVDEEPNGPFALGSPSPILAWLWGRAVAEWS